MQIIDPLVPVQFFHIYNRGNNRENIFLEEKNYFYFLELFGNYISKIADTFAYCLLKNHFHFLVWLKELVSFEKSNDTSSRSLSQPFSNFFNAYAKSINKQYHRTGSLFQARFGRRRVKTEQQLAYLIYYIHFNPQKHEFVNDFRKYQFSSYNSIISDKPTHLVRDQVIGLFGNKLEFIHFHDTIQDLTVIQDLITDDVF